MGKNFNKHILFLSLLSSVNFVLLGWEKVVGSEESDDQLGHAGPPNKDFIQYPWPIALHSSPKFPHSIIAAVSPFFSPLAHYLSLNDLYYRFLFSTLTHIGATMKSNRVEKRLV